MGSATCSVIRASVAILLCRTVALHARPTWAEPAGQVRGLWLVSCLVSAAFYDSENQGSRRAIVLTRSAKCDRVYAAHAGLAMYVFTVCLAHSNP